MKDLRTYGLILLAILSVSPFAQANRLTLGTLKQGEVDKVFLSQELDVTDWVNLRASVARLTSQCRKNASPSENAVTCLQHHKLGKGRRYYFSMHQPQVRAFYYDQILPLVSSRGEDPVLNTFRFLETSAKKACEPLVRVAGEEQFKAWFESLLSLSEYFPLLESLAEEYFTLSRLAGFSYPDNPDTQGELVSLSHVGHRMNKSASGSALPEQILSKAAGVSHFLRLPLGWKKASVTETSLHFEFDSIDSEEMDMRRVDLFKFIFSTQYFSDDDTASAPDFVGYVPAIAASLTIDSTGFYDDYLLGGNGNHGYFSHIIQLMQLVENGFPQEYLKLVSSNCWNHLLDRAGHSYWSQGFMLSLESGEQLVFYDIPIGSSAQDVQMMLSHRDLSSRLARTSENHCQLHRSEGSSSEDRSSEESAFSSQAAMRYLENMVIELDMDRWNRLAQAAAYHWPFSMIWPSTVEISFKMLNGDYFVLNPVVSKARANYLEKLKEEGRDLLEFGRANPSYIVFPGEPSQDFTSILKAYENR